MNADQRSELETILDQTSIRRRPAQDYATLSAERFVFAWSYVRTVQIFCSLLVAAGWARQLGRQLADEELTEIMEMADPPFSPEKLMGLGERYFDPVVFRLLADYGHEEPYLIAELEQRLKSHLIAKDLVITPRTTGIEVPQSRAEQLLRVNKIKAAPWRQRHYESQDLKQNALVTALEVLKQNSTIRGVPLPSFPLPLQPDFRKIWENVVAEEWRREYDEVLGMIKAGLEVTDAVLETKARDNLRTIWDTVKRRRAFGSGMEDYFSGGKRPGKSPETSCRAEWNFAEIAADSRRQEILSKTIGNITTPEESLRAREEGAEAYNFVESKWGQQGRQFLDALIANEGNVAKASSAAGVSRVTGHSWRDRIKIHLSKKNPII